MCDLKILFLLFIAYSMIGWMIEVVATYTDTKCFVNTKVLHYFIYTSILRKI